MTIATVYFSAYQQARGQGNWGRGTTTYLNDINHLVGAVQDKLNEVITATNTNEADITGLEANVLDYLNNTSASSLTIGTGSKTPTVVTDRQYVVGAFVIVARTSDPTNSYMHGQVTDWNSTTNVLTVSVSKAVGSGTFTDWTISASAPEGPSGTSTMNITGLTAEPSTASGDEFIFYDVSATANRKITRTDLRTAIFSISDLTTMTGSIAGDDYIPVQDTSAGAKRRVSYDNFTAPLVGLIIALGG